MKKSILFCALSALFAAGAAQAANVDVYGIVDTGLSYIHKDLDNGTKKTDNLSMASGISRGSRWGLRGTEDLGNGLKAGFVLENGFDSDSGNIAASAGAGRMFGREANVWVSGRLGTLSAGRLQHLTAGFGSWGIAARTISPFAHGWGTGYIGGYKTVFGFNSSRVDNALAYKTPTWNGFTAYAEYSMKTDSGAAGDENKGSSDRYAGGAVTYKNGAIEAFGGVEWIGWGNTAHKDVDDAFAVTLGGNYKFSFGRLYLAGQYFDNVIGLPTPFELVRLNKAGDAVTKGWGVLAGAFVPALGGIWRGSIGYRNAKLVNDGDYKAQRLTASIAYQYNLSKRTWIFAGANYTRDKLEMATTTKPSAVTLTTGLSHSF